MALDIRQLALASLVVLLAVCLGAEGVGAEEEKVPPLGDAEVRALLEEAAAMPRAVLDRIVEKGPLAELEDLAVLGSMPLTQAGLALPMDAWRGPGGASDIAVAPDVTPTDFRALLLKGRAPSSPTVSVLRADAIVEVQRSVSDRAARGTVKFSHGEAISGVLEWSAVIEAGAWRVLSFRGPMSGRGVEWRRGQWWVAVRRAGRLAQAGLDLLPAGHLAIRSSDLPSLGLLGDVLGETRSESLPVFHVSVTPRGRILLPSGIVGLRGLREAVKGDKRSVVHRPEGGFRRTVVLRVASATPWHVVGWTLEVLRPGEDDCPVHLYVTGRAEAQPMFEEVGALTDEGVMALGRTRTPAPDEPAALDVVIEPDPGEVPVASAYRALVQGLASAGRRVRIAVAGEGLVQAGHVLRLADLALRAGARDIDFAPTPLPPVPEGGDPGLDFELTVDHARSHPVQVQGFRLRVGGARLQGDPPVPRVVRSFWEPAGADLRTP